MTHIETFLKELDEQAPITREFMKRVRMADADWQPHEKSMKLIALATHVAELPSWIGMIAHTEELDFASAPYTPEKIESTEDLVAYSERCYQEGRAALAGMSEAALDDKWTMRSGDVIHSVNTKAEVIRMTLNQEVHHRAQLGVYFRLLGIAVPKSFGPTADYATF
ncbi:MAG: damage-inducible protein DinB [Candidatus Fluviicola riflensis]|nr:MAG: damage-inducible protein DinB [Candidatus Fluviicola riflensis]OGS76057.1 MAG: damage-inducible protein DinB [Candidatus Fluviicola riflensis]OGS81957.1 MAG: damage-inducible protein DinB [Fluviicola sp. RIFCSPHIGHO2_01_FULL_43_53]OGS83395.1 MAG: damage-inducible protein DinB [Fluviicola sp. RIFCSPHIGHO2_12_FULL_43_24]